jgi:hypothetical protein
MVCNKKSYYIFIFFNFYGLTYNAAICQFADLNFI